MFSLGKNITFKHRYVDLHQNIIRSFKNPFIYYVNALWPAVRRFSAPMTKNLMYMGVRVSVNIKKVGNVILAVKDLDKSLEFYHDVIGLPIKNQRRTWIDLGTSGALLSLHPASLTAEHFGSSIENGITIGFLVGDVKSAVDELKSKGVKIYRDVVEREAGKNAVVLDPDDYLVSLFEPSFKDKDQQTSGYQGFTPA